MFLINRIMLGFISLLILAQPSLAMKRGYENDTVAIATIPYELIEELLSRMEPAERKAFAIACKFFYAVFIKMESLNQITAEDMFGIYSDDLLPFHESSLSPLFSLKGNLRFDPNQKELGGYFDLIKRKQEAEIALDNILNSEKWSEQEIINILEQNEFNICRHKLLLLFTYSLLSQLKELSIETGIDALKHLNTCRWMFFDLSIAMMASIAFEAALHYDNDGDKITNNIYACPEVGLCEKASYAVNSYFAEFGLTNLGNPQLADAIKAEIYAPACHALKAILKKSNTSPFELSSFILLSFLTCNENVKKLFFKGFNSAIADIKLENNSDAEWFTKENLKNDWEEHCNNLAGNNDFFILYNPYFQFFNNIFIIVLKHTKDNQIIVTQE